MTTTDTVDPVRQLGRALVHLLEAKSPAAPAAEIVRRHAANEVMRLPPDVRRVVAALLREQFVDGFAISSEQMRFDGLEVENAVYRADEVYEHVSDIRCTDEVLADLLSSGLPVSAATRYGSARQPVERYISDQHERGVDITGDEHYLERRFLVDVLLECLDGATLGLVEAQVPFTDSDGRTRRIDFVLRGQRKYAIELEGRAYHDAQRIGRKRFNDEKKRQRDLQAAGYRYLPFSYDEVASGAAVGSLRRLCLSDAILRPYVRDSRDAPDQQQASTVEQYREAIVLFRDLPAQYVALQFRLVDELCEAIQDNRTVELFDRTGRYGIVGMAVVDLWTLAERCIDLYGIDLRLPEVQMTTWESADTAYSPATALATFYRSPRLHDERLDRLETRSVHHRFVKEADAYRSPGLLEVTLAETETLIGATRRRCVSLEELVASGAGGHQRYDDVPGLRPLVRIDGATGGERRFASAQPARRLVDYFARRLFGVPWLRRPQYETLIRTLAGQSSLVVLATGGGKSLCYQLAAMLLPGLTIVISPLRALIRDQLAALGAAGLSCVSGTTSDDARADRAMLMSGLANGAYRLLYVSPERLLIRSFLDEFAANAGKWQIELLAVDEAHCVSEWGHDFRPAYLSIARFLERVAAVGGARPPLLALTATASSRVREDVIQTLGIPSDGYVTYGSVDRPEISLSVHALDGAAADSPSRQELIVEVMGAVAERALAMPLGALTRKGRDGHYPHASVLFGLFANPHGTHTTPLGVADLAAVLREAEIVRDDQVRVHASTEITVCPDPSCGTHRFWSDDGEQVCERGHRFARGDEIALYDDWSEQMRANQDDFKLSRFPVLVATKGYGMGIDKRNIRAVVHSTFSSGLESYYQEIGRSGRDQAHSHAALVFQPPTEECRAEHLAAVEFPGGISGEPPCVSQSGNFRFWKCPYGLKPLCDYGLQARFIQQSYPGVEVDVDHAMQLLQRVLTEGAGSLFSAGPFGEQRASETSLALFRLSQLGVIADYNLEYQGTARVRFNIAVAASFSVDEMRATLVGSMRRVVPDEEFLAVADRIWAIPSVPTDSSESDEARFGRAALRLLLEETYRLVKGMRYGMLKNLLKYASGDESGCRRTVLRAPFDDAGMAGDHRCGFCDKCVPSLEFGRERAAVPQADLELDEVARRLPHVLEVLDLDELEPMLATVERRGALSTFQARVEHTLEREPYNVAARLLAARTAKKRAEEQGAVSSAAGEELRREALGHYAPLMETLPRVDLGEAIALEVYEEMAQVDRRVAVDVADVEGRALDTPAGRRILVRDLAAVGAVDRAITLLGHVLTDAAKEISELITPDLLVQVKGL